MAALTSRDVEHVMRTIFRRCVKCPSDEAPSCTEPCKKNEICVQTPPSCTECASVKCMPDPALAGSNDSGKTNVGAIAGGVIGGVVFVAVLVFVIWKFCLKGKRQKIEEGDWQEVDMAQTEKSEQNDFASRRSARASTHTVASMASSVLTRASNIIQIAYIPGVTNRSGPGSPDLLVPPVPPIPAMSPSSGLSSPYANSEQHFFVPDLRNSMASGTTDARTSYARTSYARTSMAPSLARNSVASTVYRQNAIVSPLPAQTVVRGKAAVVSVKSNGSSPDATPSLDTPPVPQIDSKFSTVRIQMPRMGSGPSPQNSIRSTATLGPVRALNITKKKPSVDATPPRTSHSSSTSDTLVSPARPLTHVSAVSSDDGGVGHARARRAIEAETSDDDDESDDDDHARARRSLLRDRDSQVTDINDTPISLQSPFSDLSTVDAPRPDMPQRHTSMSSGLRAPMTPIKEEASKRASSGGASKRTQSPFSDDNRSEL